MNTSWIRQQHLVYDRFFNKIYFCKKKLFLCARMLVIEWKEGTFIEKVYSRCFCRFSAAILVHQNCAPIWRLHTKLCKAGAWNVSANNSETLGHKDLRLGQIVSKLVFYNISFSWFLPLDGFQFIFLVRDSENDLLKASEDSCAVASQGACNCQ